MTNWITPNVIGELVAHAINVAEERKLIEGKTPLAEVVEVFNLAAADSTTFLLVLRTAELLSEDLVSFFADARRRGIMFENIEGHIRMKPDTTFNFAGYQSFAEYRQKQMVPKTQDIKVILKDVEGWFAPTTEE